MLFILEKEKRKGGKTKGTEGRKERGTEARRRVRKSESREGRREYQIKRECPLCVRVEEASARL